MTISKNLIKISKKEEDSYFEINKISFELSFKKLVSNYMDLERNKKNIEFPEKELKVHLV